MWFYRPRRRQQAISFDQLGFVVTSIYKRKREDVAMRWDEVLRASVFKRDLAAVDCICLLLSGHDGTGLELNEEMTGWDRFVEALPQYLMGCKPEVQWFGEVAFPPFATNLADIYVRQPAQI
jgi:hypothetical protein